MFGVGPCGMFGKFELLAKRDLNANESINVFETDLCEMRPETLENDIKEYKNISGNGGAGGTGNGNGINNQTENNAYSILDSFKSYAQNAENIQEDSFLMDKETSSALIIKCDLPDSSIITYQNYLFPVNNATTDNRNKMQHSAENSLDSEIQTLKSSSLRVNLSDENGSQDTSNTTINSNQFNSHVRLNYVYKIFNFLLLLLVYC